VKLSLRFAIWLGVLAPLLFATSCAGDPMLQVRRDFASGRYELARIGLTELVQDDSDNAHVWLLERAVASLALGDPKAAIADLRRARDRFQDVQGTDYSGWFQSVLLDDRSLEYQGADFEVVLIRAIAALASLMTGNTGDANAFALQVGEKQRDIIDSFESNDGVRPKDAYKLVAFGNYLRGIVGEGALQFDVARMQYEKVKKLEPSFPQNEENLARAQDGRIAEKGNGVVHVIALVGRGPFRVESEEPVTRDAFAIAQLMWAFFRNRATIPNIAAVKIPRLAYYPDNPTEVHVAVGGQASGVTETITDVEETARREFEAMAPYLIARAVMRRAFKVVVTEGVKEAVRPRDRKYRAENLLVDLAISGVGIAWAAMESADLRCWSLLPARFQVARLELPAGEHEIVLRAGRGGKAVGPPQRVRVRVDVGYNSYVSVMVPSTAGGPAPMTSHQAREATAQTGT